MQPTPRSKPKDIWTEISARKPLTQVNVNTMHNPHAVRLQNRYSLLIGEEAETATAASSKLAPAASQKAQCASTLYPVAPSPQVSSMTKTHLLSAIAVNIRSSHDV
jgi:hypothetical protein